MARTLANCFFEIRLAFVLLVFCVLPLGEALSTALPAGRGDGSVTHPTLFAVSSTVSGAGAALDSSETTTLIPASIVHDVRAGGLPIGAWIGIGFALLILILVGIVWFVGHKRVIEYFVSLTTRRSRKGTPLPRVSTQFDAGQLEALPVRSSSGHFSKISHSGSTPRTGLTDIPFASIEIDGDGRMSPRLPIASKRGNSSVGTPLSVHSRE